MIGLQGIFGIIYLLVLSFSCTESISFKSKMKDNLKQNENKNVNWRFTRNIYNPMLPIDVDNIPANENDLLLRNKREPEHPIGQQSLNVLNGIDLSDPEYLPDHHHGRRRVKKVLELDDPIEHPLENHEKPGLRVPPPRMKRFVLPMSFDPLLALKYLFLHRKGNNDQGNSMQEVVDLKSNKNDGGYGNAIVKTWQDDGISMTSRGNINHNVTGYELKYFHQVLLTTIASLCPDIKLENAIMIENVKRFVSTKIRVAEPSIPIYNDRNKDTVFTLVQKINQCADLEEDKIHKNHDIQEYNSKITPEFKIDPIHKYFEKEGQRLKRLTQKDIVPNPPNIIMFEKLILQLINQRCKNINEEEKKDAQRIGSILFSIIGSTSPTVMKSTIHQQEMLELIERTRNCFVNNSASSFIDALENQ